MFNTYINDLNLVYEILCLDEAPDYRREKNVSFYQEPGTQDNGEASPNY